MNFNWQDYQDYVEWNRSFGIHEQCDQEVMEEDHIHYVFSLMQNGLCDKEIADLSNTHPFLVSRMRIGNLHALIGQQYDYPIVFSRELMVERIRIMVLEEDSDVVDIVNRTGAHPSFVSEVYQQILPSKFNCNNQHGYH